jgi:hypothetical protein
MPTSPTVTVTKGRQQPARKKPAPPPPRPQELNTIGKPKEKPAELSRRV